MSVRAPAWPTQPGLWTRLAPHRALLLILAGHLVLGLGYGLAAPILEAPDEPGHYFYVRYLLVHRQLPVQGAEFYAPRAHHPPGYYLLGALLTAGVADDTPPQGLDLPLNPHFAFRQGDRTSFDNRAAFLHHGPEERFPYQGRARAVHLLRLLSLAFAAVGVLGTYGAARHLRPAQPGFAPLAAGLVAFNPIVLFTSGLVYNDTAALGAAGLVAYTLTRTARRGFSVQRWLAIGVVLGFGLLLKSSLLVLGLPAALLLAAQVGLGRRWRAAVTGALALFVPPALLAGWWYVRNRVVYGDWTANVSIGLLNGLVPPEERLARLAGNLAWLLQSMFGCGPIGPESLCYPAPFFVGAAALTLAALAGLVVMLRRWRASAGAWRVGAAGLWVLHLVLIGALGVSAVVYALTYRNTWQGRLWLPAYPSLALLLAAGLLAWVTPRRQALAANLLVGLAAAVGAYGLVGLILPAYGVPRAPLPFERATAQPLEAQLGPTARVVAYRLNRQTVAAGDTLDVTIYWEALAPTATPYTVFVHLFSPEYGSLAQRDTYPGRGNYPTHFWDRGRAFVDTYRLYLPAELPATTGYIVLGLYDEATGERLPVTGANAGPPEERWVEFGEVVVR